MYFTWGKPCKHEHQNTDGTNLRYRGLCCVCEETKHGREWAKLPQDEMMAAMMTPKLDQSPEAKAKRRVEASMRWNAKNKEHFREIQLKYQRSDNAKAKAKAGWKKRMAAISEEEKQELYRTNLNYQRAMIAKMTPEEKKAHNRKMYAQQKAALSKKSPEEQAAFIAKRKQQMADRYRRMTPEEHHANYLDRKAREKLKKEQDGSRDIPECD
jgi:type IV secretory pathway VirB10-like protein